MNGTITKYRKKDGRISWGYHYKAEGRQFTKSGFPSKFEASKALGAALGRHEDTNGFARKGDTRTLAKYLDYWLDNHAALRCQPKTLERYRQLAGNLIRLLGHIRIRDLRSGAIQEAVNWLQLRGGVPNNAHPQGRPLAPKTVHSTASLLFTCLSDAARLEHIPANPMADRKVRLPKRPKPSPAVMDAGAVAAIFEAAQGTRLYAFVVTAACSGGRRGELLALTWADLDFETGLMTVSKSLEQTRAGLRVKCTKSGKPRIIGLDDFALQVLSAHREEQDRNKIISDLAIDPTIWSSASLMATSTLPITSVPGPRHCCERLGFRTARCIRCATHMRRSCSATERRSRSSVSALAMLIWTSRSASTRTASRPTGKPRREYGRLRSRR